MKTEQEQIKEMSNIITDCLCKDCKNCKYYNGHFCPDPMIGRAEALIQAGYGNVSEYKAEIERLKKETTDTQKRTAKEILQTLYDECYEINDESGESMGDFVSDDDILHLAKHYGVEVDV